LSDTSGPNGMTADGNFIYAGNGDSTRRGRLQSEDEDGHLVTLHVRRSPQSSKR
jgi:hypothetical protein